MNDRNWNVLLSRIESGQCTPFLGAGISHPVLPLGGQIAEEWATEHKYPLPDKRDLARVAQYLAIHEEDPMWPKQLIQDRFKQAGKPNFSDPDEPHMALARLPLPLFITTNYDNFMVQALRECRKDPRQEVCLWNNSPTLQYEDTPLRSDPTLHPSPANPIVFHLHGRLDVLDSFVLTEDDYLEFLVAVSEKRETLLPHQIRMAVAGTTLLFIGYALHDWDFRVLHRGLVRGNPSLRRASVTVQMKESGAAQEYLERYFRESRVSVYWGDAKSFAEELTERWRKRHPDG